MIEAAAVPRWGTWEELVLGGAVLRHGTSAWPTVAYELTLRAPSSFTAEECETKYEDLQQHYSGSDALFVELRKRRVDELKRALQKSESSIESLQSMIEILNAERGTPSSSEYNTNHPELPQHSRNVDGVSGCCREASKSVSLPGKLSEDAERCQSSEGTASVSGRVSDLKTELCDESGGKICIGIFWTMKGCYKRKRGKRKRKIFNIKEVRNNAISWSSMVDKSRQITSGGQSQGHGKNANVDLVKGTNAVSKQKGASDSRRQLEENMGEARKSSAANQRDQRVHHAQGAKTSSSMKSNKRNQTAAQSESPAKKRHAGRPVKNARISDRKPKESPKQGKQRP